MVIYAHIIVIKSCRSQASRVVIMLLLARVIVDIVCDCWSHVSLLAPRVIAGIARCYWHRVLLTSWHRVIVSIVCSCRHRLLLLASCIL
jgi:hypothetical protein